MSEGPQKKQFSSFRAFFWPIHGYECKKFFPMLLLFFLLNFNYNVLRSLKDSLVITAEGSGAEVIPFIKVWVMFPTSIIMTWFFARVSNRASRENVFYIIFSVFLLYYFIFIAFLYPNRDAIHLHGAANYLEGVLPLGFKGFIAMVRYWSFTSFYVMSELWGNIILFLLFWGFANEITRVNEAKRFYGLFGIGANLSGVAAGYASIYLCRHEYNPFFFYGNSAWEQSLFMMVSLIIIVGLLVMVIFSKLNKFLFRNEKLCDQSSVKNMKGKPKEKMSLWRSCSYVLQSRYLLSLTLIVVSYNLVINLVEVLWKHQVRALYPSPGEYHMYMSQVTVILGVIATFVAFFVSGNLIRKFGWTVTAMVTPVTLFVTSILFFGFFFLQEPLAPFMASVFGVTPLMATVFFGSLQNCLSRGCKYTVFDATKEMAFIPLSSSSRSKGKAAIDGVCIRLGKSGGSVIYQGLLVVFSTIIASAPYIAVVLLCTIIIWMFAVRLLGLQFHDLTAKASNDSQEELIKEDRKEVAKPLFEEAIITKPYPS